MLTGWVRWACSAGMGCMSGDQLRVQNQMAEAIATKGVGWWGECLGDNAWNLRKIQGPWE